jgi:hypothetical protein
MLNLNAGKIRENYGIKILKDDPSYVAIWKSSNVGISRLDKVVRPAAVSVEEWVSAAHIHPDRNIWRTCLDINSLSVSSSGIFIVPRKDHDVEFSSVRFVVVGKVTA